MSRDLYTKNNLQLSRLTTMNYSTSFSLGVRMLSRKIRDPIFAIYGYVRYADEIVDTFFGYPQEEMLEEFIHETYRAIERGISTNPILDSFQMTVNKYGIEREHIDAFLESMRMDLYNHNYEKSEVTDYIYGSAEVVGLMCLRVFYYDDDEQYEFLKYHARKLGEAFQKVNFLRDIQSDYSDRERIYFADISNNGFSAEVKRRIEQEIQHDFDEAYQGIKILNKRARFGVYLAYIYYQRLFRKIRKSEPNVLMSGRIRIPNSRKISLLLQAYLRNSMNLF
ncbi:MAG: phytoene/squalene synthase family protein [Bacteroidales bacterium]|nr:phytoene/squalene synthase family protein [Bacteroidales bacterium]MBS3776637.1 phytoene/squalene synthase family protein [Bacteroidales bacterium]